MAKRALMWAIAAWCGLASGGLAACGRSSDVAGVNESGPPVDLTPENANFVACDEKSESAKLVPVSMFIAIDKSGSMAMNGKWNALKTALNAFFADPGAQQLNVALRFWPDDMGMGTCNGMACDVNACAAPTVPLGPLSDAAHRSALTMALNATTPAGDTPMSAALAGAEQWAAAHMKAAPNEKVIVVLVTDGQPTKCDTNLANIAALAGSANKSQGTLTYAIGFPGSAQNEMDQIAAAGGTGMGFFLSGTATEMDFLAAMLAISGKTVACTLPITQNAKLEPKLVNVVYGSGSAAGGKLTHVQGPMDCANGGWYYDNPTAPTNITLCPSTCSTVKKDAMATVQFKIGCKCMSDADCPSGTVCSPLGCVTPCTPGVDCAQQTGASSDGTVALQPDEAVQGGSMTCSAGGTGARGSMWWWGALAAMIAARRWRSVRR